MPRTSFTSGLGLPPPPALEGAGGSAKLTDFLLRTLTSRYYRYCRYCRYILCQVIRSLDKDDPATVVVLARQTLLAVLDTGGLLWAKRLEFSPR